MPLVQTRGAASAQGFGEFAQVTAANYIEDMFSCFLYTGNGATQTITNGIDVTGKGALVWLKNRTAANSHFLFDTVRGVGTGTQALSSNTTAAGGAGADIAFSSTGFNLTQTGSNTNASSNNYVSWTFRKQPKFFDVVTYTGTAGGTKTISHNLGSVPGMLIVKSTTRAGDRWFCWHRSIPTQRLILNTDGAQDSGASEFGDGTNVIPPTSTQFTVGNNSEINDTGQTYVAYLFAHDAGGFGLSGTDNVISCGSFTTDGSGNASVNLGYEPQWVMQKRTDSSTGGNWYIADNMRGMNVSGSLGLFPNLADTEETSLQGVARINATGFTANRFANATYIYIAIRRGPMKVPTLGTSVFAPVTATAANNLSVTAGFPVDLAFVENRVDGINRNVNDRLRGGTTTRIISLESNSTSAEQTYTGNGISFNSNSTGIIDNFTNFNQGASSMVYWLFRRAPSFFDEVCYTGTGVNRTVAHNLAAVPELMIVKVRSIAERWSVYSAPTTATTFLILDGTTAATTNNFFWNDTAPTSSVFTLGTQARVNNSGSTYVAYLFATCAGVSKVGSYTGTGALQTINCGFTGSARFVLIKRTDSTGDWWTYDSARGITSGNDPYLYLNSAAAEVTGTNYVDTDSTGFKVTAAAPAELNANGGTYIFLAIA